MNGEIFNLGLEPKHAPSNARGGMKNIQVIFLPKGLMGLVRPRIEHLLGGGRK